MYVYNKMMNNKQKDRITYSIWYVHTSILYVVNDDDEDNNNNNSNSNNQR